MESYEIIYKHFDELTNLELYEILRARSEVFVVEQNCVCQDLDGRDVFSFHLFAKREDGSVAGCLRIFMKPDEEHTAVIGRVVTTARGCGLGGRLLHEAVCRIREENRADQIYIEAQQYAIGYYQKEGFKVVSGLFLEDGIPHVQMRLHLETSQEEGEG